MLDIYNTSLVHLKCEADGNPIPKIVWYKNGLHLSDVNLIQIYPTHSTEDSYTCSASNILKYIENEIVLNFISKPILTFSYREFHRVKETEKFLLECPIESKIDRIEWLQVLIFIALLNFNF